jgi:hypothetical protein
MWPSFLSVSVCLACLPAHLIAWTGYYSESLLNISGMDDDDDDDVGGSTILKGTYMSAFGAFIRGEGVPWWRKV